MASEAQINANRNNATSSTGPQTAEGKAASSLNALKHGLRARSRVLPGEDPAEYDALTAGVYEEYQPENAYQEALVQEIVDYFWWCWRQRRVEDGLFSTHPTDERDTDILLKVIKACHNLEDSLIGWSSESEPAVLDLLLNCKGNPRRSEWPAELGEILSRFRGTLTQLGTAYANEIVSNVARRSPSQSEDGREESKIDDIVFLFGRNQRFFGSLARYSTSKHNRFLAVLDELRRCKDRAQGR